MIAEILSIGTELLMGQIANTDAQYISRRLAELGVNLYRHTTVGDNPARVKEALGEAIARADIVITTGGLGPTEDDLTKEMVAEFFGLPMEMHAPSLEALTERMNRLGREITPNNYKQAMMPRGAIVMPNLRGTAPGAIVESGQKAVAILPGPPHEMQDMFERQLAPYLHARTGVRIDSRFLHVCGIGESSLETLLLDLFHSENPTLALYCGAGEVQARLSARVGANEDSAPLLDPLEKEIRRPASRPIGSLPSCSQYSRPFLSNSMHFLPLGKIVVVLFKKCRVIFNKYGGHIQTLQKVHCEWQDSLLRCLRLSCKMGI